MKYQNLYFPELLIIFGEYTFTFTEKYLTKEAAKT